MESKLINVGSVEDYFYIPFDYSSSGILLNKIEDRNYELSIYLGGSKVYLSEGYGRSTSIDMAIKFICDWQKEIEKYFSGIKIRKEWDNTKLDFSDGLEITDFNNTIWVFSKVAGQKSHWGRTYNVRRWGYTIEKFFKSIPIDEYRRDWHKNDKDLSNEFEGTSFRRFPWAAETIQNGFDSRKYNETFYDIPTKFLDVSESENDWTDELYDEYTEHIMEEGEKSLSFPQWLENKNPDELTFWAFEEEEEEEMEPDFDGTGMFHQLINARNKINIHSK